MTNVMLSLGIMILSGVICAAIISKLKLPAVTGFLIGGVLIGTSCLNLISPDVINRINFLSDVALGLIAYVIGSEFNFKHIKKIGKSAFMIGLFESLIAFVLVSLSMYYIFKMPSYVALLLGAISSATAPAATIMVINQYKAKGPLVDILIPVVTLDDVFAIVIFGISSSIASSMISGSSASVATMLIHPLIEIGSGILIGVILAFILAQLLKKTPNSDSKLCITLGFILLNMGLANVFHASSLISAISLGATIANILPNYEEEIHIVDKVTPPLMILFFSIAGMQLDFSVLMTVGVAGFGYLFIRIFGKFCGAFIGGVLSDAPKQVKNNLGLTLLPQAGIGLALCMACQSIVPEEYGSKIMAIILAATVVNELIGPLLTKFALKRAGEINEINITSKSSAA